MMKAAPALESITSRSTLAQLLHALNQPLTGLQCSMEVALAGTRTLEQYRQGLRDGLELTERMRTLVEAIREVADGLEESKDKNRNEANEAKETTDLISVLRETVTDLQPLADSKRINIALDCQVPCQVPLTIVAKKPMLTGLMFRLLDSVLSLAPEGSAVKIAADSAESGGGLRICWEAEGNVRQPVSSRPELGLLVSQAGFERSGAEWQRLWEGKQETISIRLPENSRQAS
jgi:signal transduction histidine kinase